MIGRFLDPKNDYAFKRIFGREQNKDLLMAMLNAILGDQLHQEIVDLSFLPRNQDPEVGYAKESAVDVLCRDTDGCQYVIEMQVAKQDGFQKRAQYYAAKTFVNQARSGDKYHNLQAVIFLAFVDFELFPKKKKYKSTHVLLDKESKEHDLDLFSFTFIELKKFMAHFEKSKKQVADLTSEEKFYYFLKEAEAIDEERLEIFTSDDIFKKAFREIELMNWNEADFNTYESALKASRDALNRLATADRIGREEGMREGIKEGIKEGLRAGVEKGKKEGLRAAAQKMLALGVDIEVIAQSTQLTIKQIEALKGEK